MRVLVCGSRDWTNYDAVVSALTDLPGEHGPITVVHGDARGADHDADVAARYLGFAVERHPAKWRTHGKRAGFLRNIEMLDSGIDLVIAFQLNGSRGTQHTINEARKRGIPVEVHRAA